MSDIHEMPMNTTTPAAAGAASNGAVAMSLERSAMPAVLKNGQSKSDKVNILIVDDRDDKLLALDAILGSLGQNIVKAKSGKEALRHLLKQEFAVILLDVSMPGMDGFETAALIRKRPLSEHTPILFVTSVGSSTTQMYQGYSLGAVDYILTPIVPEVLRTKVSVFVDLWRKTQQVWQQAERLRDIEQAEHQRQLADAADRLEKETKRNRFFTLALDMLGIGTFDGKLLQVNPTWEKVLGYTEEELKNLGQATELMHPEDLPLIGLRVEALKKGLPVDYFEARARHKDGSYRWLGWTAAAFPEEKLIYIFGRDVTARKEAEDEIRKLNGELERRVTALTEANRELEAFNYSISHDLRAPLRSMGSFGQALLEDEDSQVSPQGREFANRIIRSAKYMDTLLSDLLAYSRLTRTEMTLSTIQLEDAVNEVLLQVENQTRDKHAEIQVQSPLGSVCAHLPTLKQVLANLINNGLKFVSPDRPPVLRVYSTVRSSFVRLWIEDNGIGIDGEYYEKIFGLFERLHSEGRYPGTGVGLALVRKGAERMGGRVGLESEPGRGSRFWVELPAASNGEPL
jgi:PAS domain S-box-containing protein